MPFKAIKGIEVHLFQMVQLPYIVLKNIVKHCIDATFENFL